MPKEIPGPLTSPQVWTFEDYMNRKLTINIFFNINNQNLDRIEVNREVGCLYQTILWGVGTDGIPDNTDKKFTVPVGDFTISKGMINGVGLAKLNDIQAVQFTVGF